MKFLRRTLDRIAPLFHKGGRLEKLYPLYEAADSFLYTTAERTSGGSHVRDGNDMKRTMMAVVIALIPCTLMALYNSGYQAFLAEGKPAAEIGLLAAAARGALLFFPIYLVTIAVGGAIEALFATVRKHEINEGFLVTSLLFPLILPPTIPWWQAALGIAFGVLFGKEVFGGTGMNILNPALTGRIFLFFAYPAQMSGDLVWIAGDWVDGYSGATALSRFAAQGTAPISGGELDWWSYFTGLVPGSMGETSTVACLIGAAVLIASQVGSWRIMLSCLLGMAGMSLLLNLLAPAPGHYMAVPWYWHLVTGGFAFGAVFMATDPVSAAQTDPGRWIYGALIGVLTVLVRVLNPAYPEGMMLSVIFMNVFAPVIDYYVMKANIKQRARRLELQQ